MPMPLTREKLNEIRANYVAQKQENAMSVARAEGCIIAIDALITFAFPTAAPAEVPATPIEAHE